MTPFLQFSFVLVIILLAAKTAGYLSVRIGQPSVLGELLVGVLLGPSLINLLHVPVLSNETLGETITHLGEIGVLLLMFIAGLELHLDELRQTLRASAFAGMMGVILPFALGWGTGLLFGLDPISSIFLGLILGATSVSISAQTLMELKVLRSRVGISLLGAAVFDDVLVILMLSIFFALLNGTGGILGVLLVAGRMVLFFSLAAGFGLWVLPRLVRWVRNLPISQNVLTLAIIVLFGYSLAAELIGSMAAITGAFLAGLMFARSPERESLNSRISALAYGFFVPIFFVNIGLSVNVAGIRSGLWLTAVILVVAVLGKMLGATLGAKWAGFNWSESWQVGAGMISRGEVGLIVASVGLHAGLVDETEFAAIVTVVVISTLITPPILRYLFKRSKVVLLKTQGVQKDTQPVPADPKENQ